MARADPLAWVYGALNERVAPGIYSQTQQAMPDSFVLINAASHLPDRQGGHEMGFTVKAAFTSVAPADSVAYDNCHEVIDRLWEAYNSDEENAGLVASGMEVDLLPTQSEYITVVEWRDVFQYTFSIDFYFQYPD